MQNKGVSYFEECLTFGDLLLQDERRALYKYLLETNQDFYTVQAISLLDSRKCTRIIANGEASYFIKDNFISYSARKLNSDEISDDVRPQQFFSMDVLQVLSVFAILIYSNDITCSPVRVQNDDQF